MDKEGVAAPSDVTVLTTNIDTVEVVETTVEESVLATEELPGPPTPEGTPLIIGNPQEIGKDGRGQEVSARLVLDKTDGEHTEVVTDAASNPVTQVEAGGVETSANPPDIPTLKDGDQKLAGPLSNEVTDDVPNPITQDLEPGTTRHDTPEWLSNQILQQRTIPSPPPPEDLSGSLISKAIYETHLAYKT